MLKHPHKTWVEISSSALLHNAQIFKKQLGKKTQLMAVVKSNAYGHGAREVVPLALQGGATWLGVDSIDEALVIEDLCPDTPILILGYTLLGRLAEAAEHGFRLTVYNPETIRALGTIAKRLKKTVHLHIKCETGTARQGVLLEDLVPLAKLIGSYEHLVLEGLSTHFANIEDTTNHAYADRQLLHFKRMNHALENIGIRVPMRHAACSAAAILFPETHFNMARVGISLYGLWSSHETRLSAQVLKKQIELRPVLSWKTCLAQIKTLPAGTSIGYGLTERLSRPGRIAVIPIGYRDGYDRHLSSVGTVLVRGQRARVVGRVCMNMCMIDVSGIRGATIEDEVTIIGRDGKGSVTADDIAQKLGTINYEVVTCINPLIPHLVV